MGDHLKDGKFQSDKYPTCPAGKVPLSTSDPMAQDLLREYARRRRAVDAEFADDLVAALAISGYDPLAPGAPHGGDTRTEVFFYERDFYCLSNFSAFALTWWGVEFPTSEHAYQWAKFTGRDGAESTLPQREVQERIRTARSAHDAFKLARAAFPILVRPDWAKIRIVVMEYILRAKVAQHPYVRHKLLATGDRALIEDSWRDDFWGWGETGSGENMLGILWMRIRAELRTSSAADRGGRCDGQHAGGACVDRQCWHRCPMCGSVDGGCGCVSEIFADPRDRP